MSARIRSLQNGINAVDEQSRDDLVLTDIVTVSSLDAATTYSWTLVFVPEGSLATFSGSSTAVSPGTFTIDVEGPYLVRLIVDSGLVTEDTQYVRLRALTSDLGLTLVAAGERRDGTGIIPVDIDAEGWAYEQNANLLALEAAAVAAQARVDTYQDQLVTATMTVPDVGGGGTDAALTLQLRRAHDNSTNIASARQVLILACDAQYEPMGSVSLSGTTTFAAATTGSIVASAAGWALVLTSATGAFACTATNTADETLYFRAITAEAVSDLTQRCAVVGSNSDAATWSA